MDAQQLFEAGKLAEALDAQTEAVKAAPTDLGCRTFYFELLAFSGDLQRARKQLDVIGQQDTQLEPIAQAYRNILTAETTRRRLYSDGLKPKFLLDPPDYLHKHLEALNRLRDNQPEEAGARLAEAFEAQPDLAGQVDGTAFEDFRDCDDILAPVLELYIGPDYFWLPLEQVEHLEIGAPEKPRDLIWSTAQVIVTGGSQHRGHMPVLYHGSHEAEDVQVRLGRKTDWKESPNGPVLGLGQRLFLIGEEARPMLEVRDVKFGE